MLPTHEKRLLLDAIESFGSHLQEDKAIEEMGELIAAIHHYRNRKLTRLELMHEIVDVSIMVDQMALIHGFENCKKLRDVKLNRLIEIVSEFKESK